MSGQVQNGSVLKQCKLKGTIQMFRLRLPLLRHHPLVEACDFSCFTDFIFDKHFAIAISGYATMSLENSVACNTFFVDTKFLLRSN